MPSMLTDGEKEASGPVRRCPEFSSAWGTTAGAISRARSLTVVAIQYIGKIGCHA